MHILLLSKYPILGFVFGFLQYLGKHGKPPYYVIDIIKAMNMNKALKDFVYTEIDESDTTQRAIKDYEDGRGAWEDPLETTFKASSNMKFPNLMYN
ncbi:hypothetical protein Q3G72_030755 [Acer saccharum]|nr:hypothetical protein Q3G72_030755 [Acer saccharum]